MFNDLDCILNPKQNHIIALLWVITYLTNDTIVYFYFVKPKESSETTLLWYHHILVAIAFIATIWLHGFFLCFANMIVFIEFSSIFVSTNKLFKLFEIKGIFKVVN